MLSRMYRIRRYFLPLLFSMPMFYIGGELLLTPVESTERFHYDEEPVLIAYLDCLDIGWPWIFEQRGEISNPAHAFHGQIAPFSFSLLLLVADLIVIFAGVLLAAALGNWLFRRFMSRRQFSVRSIIVLTGVVGISVAEIAQRFAESRRLDAWQRKLSSQGILVRIDDVSPDWARRLLPDDLRIALFFRATGLRQWDETTPAGLEAAISSLTDLRRIRWIEFGDSPILYVPDPVLLSGVERLQCSANDESLISLSKLTGVRKLSLSGPITDRGLLQLKNCASLEELALSHADISGSGILQLRELRNLKKVWLYDPKAVSEDAVCLLRKSIPDVHLVNLGNMP